MPAKSIFRAYDIRGAYPREINEATAEILGRVLGKYFKRGQVIVGHDVRLSSPALYAAVRWGLLKENPGLQIISAGLITAPMLYFLVNYYRAAGGVMITASHNPQKYNGLKIVGPGAAPLSGQDILRLVKKYLPVYD